MAQMAQRKTKIETQKDDDQQLFDSLYDNFNTDLEAEPEESQNEQELEQDDNAQVFEELSSVKPKKLEKSLENNAKDKPIFRVCFNLGTWESIIYHSKEDALWYARTQDKPSCWVGVRVPKKYNYAKVALQVYRELRIIRTPEQAEKDGKVIITSILDKKEYSTIDIRQYTSQEIEPKTFEEIIQAIREKRYDSWEDGLNQDIARVAQKPLEMIQTMRKKMQEKSIDIEQFIFVLSILDA